MLLARISAQLEASEWFAGSVHGGDPARLPGLSSGALGRQGQPLLVHEPDLQQGHTQRP